MVWKSTIFSAILYVTVVNCQNVEEKFFDQNLDHNSKTPGTWKQRYLENRQYYKPGGPILLYIGGPRYALIHTENLKKGAIVDYAKQLNGNLIGLEERYYGKSRPTSDLTTQNLEKYLTVAQSVEDYKNFAKWLKTQPEFKNSKIIGFAAGLLGSRLIQVLKNDTAIIDIAVMSSTPVEIKYEFHEFSQVAAELLTRGHKECFDAVQDTLQCFQKLSKDGSCQDLKFVDLKSTLGLCADIDPKNELDKATLMFTILRIMAGVVLTNNPDPSSRYNLAGVCNDLNDNSTGNSHAERVGVEFRKVHEFLGMPCMDVRFEKQFEFYNNPSWESFGVLSGERQALYLRCSQAGMIRTPSAFKLDDKGQFSVTFFTEMCKRLFNITPETTKTATELTNAVYGSRKLPPQCGIFTSGTDDLFKALAVQNQTEAGNCNRAIPIEGASFAKDFGEIRPAGMSYPPALRDSQLLVGSTIADWLKTGNCCSPK